MIFAASISDVLSGASLVMAVLAALFAIWQPEINKALDATVKPDKDNRKPETKLVTRMKWGRVMPLLIVTLLAAALLTPRSFSILINTGKCLASSMPTNGCHFDEAGGLFLLTETLLLLLAVAMWAQITALNTKRDELAL